MLDEYLQARRTYFATKLDLEEALKVAIAKKDGSHPDVIRDILDWTDGSIRVLVSDYEFKRSRHLLFSRAEVEEAIKEYKDRLGR